MAEVITIPRRIAQKGDLVLLPRREYEELLSVFRVISKDQLWFWTKEWQKREREAEEDIKAGRIFGPFSSAEELVRSIKSKR